MNFLPHDASVDFFESVQTGYDMAPGNRTAAPNMLLRSSIPYSESSVSGRRKRNKWADEVSFVVRYNGEPNLYFIVVMLTTDILFPAQEDAILFDAVRNQCSVKVNWPLVAHRVNQESGHEPRTGKQCRERWRNHLRPDIKKGNWTAQEEEMIRVLFDAYGPK